MEMWCEVSWGIQAPGFRNPATEDIMIPLEKYDKSIPP